MSRSVRRIDARTCAGRAYLKKLADDRQAIFHRFEWWRNTPEGKEALSYSDPVELAWAAFAEGSKLWRLRP